MKLYKRVAAVLLACLLALSLAACGGGGGGGGTGGGSSTVAINSTNFPDATFRAYVSGSSIDTNQDGVLSASELKAVTQIDVSSKGITDLTGIEYFTELNKLYCSNNKLTKLDISKNVKLQYLFVGANQLTTLDVSKNTELLTLNCDSNSLTSLDLKNNSKLNDLYCTHNNLTVLDLSGTAITKGSGGVITNTIGDTTAVEVIYADETTDPDSSSTDTGDGSYKTYFNKFTSDRFYFEAVCTAYWNQGKEVQMVYPIIFTQDGTRAYLSCNYDGDSYEEVYDWSSQSGYYADLYDSGYSNAYEFSRASLAAGGLGGGIIYASDYLGPPIGETLTYGKDGDYDTISVKKDLYTITFCFNSSGELKLIKQRELSTGWLESVYQVTKYSPTPDSTLISQKFAELKTKAEEYAKTLEDSE